MSNGGGEIRRHAEKTPQTYGTIRLFLGKSFGGNFSRYLIILFRFSQAKLFIYYSIVNNSIMLPSKYSWGKVYFAPGEYRSHPIRNYSRGSSGT